MKVNNIQPLAVGIVQGRYYCQIAGYSRSVSQETDFLSFVGQFCDVLLVLFSVGLVHRFLSCTAMSPKTLLQSYKPCCSSSLLAFCSSYFGSDSAA